MTERVLVILFAWCSGAIATATLFKLAMEPEVRVENAFGLLIAVVYLFASWRRPQ